MYAVSGDVIDFTERLKRRDGIVDVKWTIIFLSSVTDLECVAIVNAPDAETALHSVPIEPRMKGRGALVAVRGALFVEFV